MNFAMVRYLLGWILLCEGALMTLPAAVSALYRETAGWALLGTAALCAALGGLLLRKKP